MALDAGGGGRRAPKPPWQQQINWQNPWALPAQYRRPTPRPSAQYRRPAESIRRQDHPSRMSTMEDLAGLFATPTPQTAPPSIPAAAPPVTINIGGGGGGGGGGGDGGVAPAPAAPQSAYNPWDAWQPTRENLGDMASQLWLRPQDWRSIPTEVRGEVMRWLRGQGWRPGGRWGRYGATEWQSAAPQEMGWGQEAFTGIPENLRPWIWWLMSAKNYTSAAPGTVARPETTGWSW